jgi:protein phosphatase
MKTEIKKFYRLNEQGKRGNQEDFIYPGVNVEQPVPGLFIVCDGMGGRESGEIASEMACAKFARFFADNPVDVSDKEYIKSALLYVEAEFEKHLKEYPECVGMGTTLTLVHFHSKGATIAHIGDSRIHHLRDDMILSCTEDHSTVMQLVKSGIITAEEAMTHEKKNQIYRAIQGTGKKATTADVKLITDIRSGDVFFMCTDGVLESFSDKDLVDTIFHNESGEAIISVIKQICTVNSNDNFSALLIPLTEVVFDENDKLAENEINNNTNTAATVMPATEDKSQPDTIKSVMVDSPGENEPLSELKSKNPTVPAEESPKDEHQPKEEEVNSNSIPPVIELKQEAKSKKETVTIEPSKKPGEEIDDTAAAFPGHKAPKLKASKKPVVFSMRIFWVALISICLLALLYFLEPWNSQPNPDVESQKTTTQQSKKGKGENNRETNSEETRTEPKKTDNVKPAVKTNNVEDNIHPNLSVAAAIKDAITWKPFKSNGKWGFKNKAGETVIEPMYDSIIGDYNGIIIHKKANGGEELTRIVTACVKKDNIFFLIDTDGKEFKFDPSTKKLEKNWFFEK